MNRSILFLLIGKSVLIKAISETVWESSGILNYLIPSILIIETPVLVNTNSEISSLSIVLIFK